MKKRTLVAFLGILLATSSLLQAGPQFTPEEVAERTKWEKYLETAAIVEQEQMISRQAVTEPWKLTLEKDGVKRYALWKDVQGRLRGALESWKWEIAAYRLDKYLGLHMISPTVERRFLEDPGSCQLWVDSWADLREIARNNIEVPKDKSILWLRSYYLQQAFDNLIANEDRHLGNVLITSDWRKILIDHSRTFRTSRKFTKQLIFTSERYGGEFIMRELPRSFVDRVRALDFDGLREIVGPYLTDKEIRAVLVRKKLLLEEIERRIELFGENNVLY